MVNILEVNNSGNLQTICYVVLKVYKRKLTIFQHYLKVNIRKICKRVNVDDSRCSS